MDGRSIRSAIAATGLSLVTLLFIGFIWRLQPPSPDAFEPVAGELSKAVQAQKNDALVVLQEANVRRMQTITRSAATLAREIRALDPVRAPSTDALRARTLPTARERFDPGPSAYERSRLESRTPSGVSSRALQAYTRETGISASQVEALMQR